MALSTVGSQCAAPGRTVDQAELVGPEWQLPYGGRARASMAFHAEFAHAHGERVRISPREDLGLHTARHQSVITEW